MRQEPPDTNEEVEKTLDAQLQAGLNNNGPSNIEVKKEATDTRPVDVSNILDSVGSFVERKPDEVLTNPVDTTNGKKNNRKRKKGLRRQSTVVL